MGEHARMRWTPPTITLVSLVIFVIALADLFDAKFDNHGVAPRAATESTATTDAAPSGGASAKPTATVILSEHSAGDGAVPRPKSDRPLFPAPTERSIPQQSPPTAVEFFNGHPDFFARFEKAYKLGIRVQYDALFRTLGATEAEIDAFEKLMMEHMYKWVELPKIAAAQSVPTSSGPIRKLNQQMLDEREAAIERTLGREFRDAYIEYTETLETRSEVDQLALQVRTTGEPLTLSQANELTRLLVEHHSLEPTFFGDVVHVPGPQDFDGVRQVAGKILSPRQMEVFEARLNAREAELALQIRVIRPAEGVRSVMGYPER